MKTTKAKLYNFTQNQEKKTPKTKLKKKCFSCIKYTSKAMDEARIS